MKWTMGRNQRRDEGADPGEQHHRVGTYLNANDARLGETSVLARRVDDGLTARQGFPP
jgi:hypothetical protein